VKGIINIKNKIQIDLISFPILLIGVLIYFKLNKNLGIIFVIIAIIVAYIRLTRWDIKRIKHGRKGNKL